MNSSSQNSNNNSNETEGETSGTSCSANRISQVNTNCTPAPNPGVEVSVFHSVEDISICRINCQTETRENLNSNTESTVLKNTAIQTFPQITVPFPQRNKGEREYATAKPNKFRKIRFLLQECKFYRIK